MSTALYDTTPHDAAPRNGARQRSGHRRGRHSGTPGDFAPRIYRGRSVDELIPRIVSELGEDAVVIRHHRGLTGGFAGFFQRPLVEIEARPGVPGIDRYDEDEAAPALPGDENLALAGEDAFALPGEEALALPDDSALAPPGEEALASLPGGETSSLPEELEDSRAAHAYPPEEWGGPRQIWATNPFAAALAEAEAAVRAAEPAVPPDLDAALAEALAEAEEAGIPTGSGELELPAELVAADLHTALPDRPAEVQDGWAPTAPTVSPDPLAGAPGVFIEPEDAAPPAEPPDLRIPIAAPLARASASDDTSAKDDTGERDDIERTLLAVGIGGEFMQELIEGAIAHVLTLMPASTSLTQAVRTALAQRIPMCPPLPATGATIAVVGAGGSGKSAFCAALLDAYREHGTLPAICTTIGSESPHPTFAEPGPRKGWPGGLQLLDTPPVSCADPSSIGSLAELLATLAPDRVVLALPATLGATPAAQLLEALRPLGASALAITHADETDQLGVAVQAACTFGLAPLHLLARTERGGTEGGLAWIDPWLLVDRLLPPR
jgi:hypothetical protein